MTYTPMVRPGAAPAAPTPTRGPLVPVVPAPSPPAVAPPPARVAPPAAVSSPPAAVPAPPPSYTPSFGYPTPLPAAPAMPPGWFAPVPDVGAAPAYAPAQAPTGSAAVWPGGPAPVPRGSEGPVAVAAAAAKPRPAPTHRTFGMGLDLGVPDGANLGLVLSPAPWVRLTAAAGTNSASLGYRGGLTFVPVGWGPSFTFEVGHCNMAATNSLIRTAFAAPAWVKPYVQEFGYTYVNAHLGFEVPLGGFVVFLRGGYSYIMGTLRAPDSVVVDTTTNTKVTIAGDGEVNASTLSAKLGLLYMFGGS